MAKIPTVTLALIKKHRQDTDGYIKVKIWIPGRNRALSNSTGYKISQQDWNAADQVVKKSHPKADIINREINRERDAIVERLETELKRGTEFTELFLRSLFESRSASGEFIVFYEQYLNYNCIKWTANYYNHYLVEYNYLVKKFGENLTFADITTQFLQRFEMSLTCAKTTKYGKMKKLKQIIDSAITQEFIRPKQLAGYRWPEDGDPEASYLTLDETEIIANAIYAGKLSDDKEMLQVACFFLVECYSGIRFSDWGRFEIETLVHDRNLKVRAKKNGEPVYLPLGVFRRLGRIIDYIQEHNIRFDLSEQMTNRLLKLLVKHPEIKLKRHPDLTTHRGRHTCGTLLGEMGYSDNEIADVLGITPMTARRYTHRTRQGLNNAFARYGGL